MTDPIKNISVLVSSSGQYKAVVEFAHTLSESDTRPEFNLNRHLPKIRSRARTKMVDAIARVEQGVNETLPVARDRVRKALSRLAVAEQNVDSQGLWYGVSFQENFWVMRSAQPNNAQAPLVPQHGQALSRQTDTQ